MPLTPEEQQAFLRAMSSRQRGATTTLAGRPADEAPVSPGATSTQAAKAPEPAAGFGDLFPGFIADPFRAAVPRRVRDVAGAVAQNIVSGERFLNTAGGFVGQENLGTRASEAVFKTPVVGGALRTGLDVATSPLSLATIGFGPTLAGGLRGLGFAGRAAAGIVEPLTLGGPAARAAAELGLGLGFEGGMKLAERAGVPSEIALLAGFGGGAYVAGTIGGVMGKRAARRLRKSPDHIDELLAQRGKPGGTVKYAEGLLRTADILESQGKQMRAQTVERGRRFGNVSREIARRGASVEAFAAGRTRLAGELPRGAEFEFTRGGFSTAELDDLSLTIWDHKLFKNLETGARRSDAVGEMLDTQAAMLRALQGGEVPTRSEMVLLERVFGPEFVEPLKDMRGRGRKALETGLDLVNVPRAVMSSSDLSAWLRQGAIFSTRKEAYTNLWPMVRAFMSEGYARKMEELSTAGAADIAGSAAAAARRHKAGNVHTYLDGQTFAREEMFMSSLAEHVPLVRRSQRAFTTYLNKLRDDVFDNTALKWDKAGVATAADEKSLANWMATSTGRGVMTPNEWTTVAGSLFFSPQKFIANMKVISGWSLANATPMVRREVFRDMVGFVTVGISALAMMNLAGKSMGFPVSIELNPLSSDFGKGKVGKLRYDPWAGFQPIARYIAQFVKGERETLGGKRVEQERGSTVARFAQSKLAPVPGAFVDLIRGETFLGEDVRVTSEEQMSELAASRLVPMFVQDLLEAAGEEGSRGLLKALPGALGVGVGSYTSLKEERNLLALQATDGEFRWDELSNLQQQQITEANKERLESVAGEPEKDSFTVFRQKVDDETRTAEAGLMAAISGGADPRAVNEALVRLWRERGTKLSTAAERAGFDADEVDAVDAYYRALDEAELAFGIVDFALRDQIAETYLAGVDDQTRKRIEESQTFVHDPSVRDFIAARDTIRESGYWKKQEEAFGDQAERIARVSEGADTYFQLANQARVTGGLAGSRIKTVLDRIDRRTTRLRERMRKASPSLDDALVLVYGLTPIGERQTSRRRARRRSRTRRERR